MNKDIKRIYMDYAATTPVAAEVMEEMMPYFSERYGNPSSVHGSGEEAQEGLIEARKRVAELLNCETNEVIFTSGATEGNNSVIKSVIRNPKLNIEGTPHIIVSDIEHDCILESAKRLMREGLAEVSFIPVGTEGYVRVDLIKDAIKPNTVLVSVMYANNETGVIQPIREIGAMLSEVNTERTNKIYFHTDAAQAVNYLDCDVKRLGVDMMTLSAHKIYGPKGVGAIFVKKGTPFLTFMNGGEQEFHMRAGTHNVPGIVGLGAAISKVKENYPANEKLKELRDMLIDGIIAAVPDAALNGSRDMRLPNNVNMRFMGAEGEAILISLDGEGFSVSTGSACAAKSLSPSHVLKAMGLSDLDAHSSIRFSLGRYTTKEDIQKLIEVLPKIMERLRGVSGSFGEGTFWEEDQVETNRGGLPADLGCEKNNKPVEDISEHDEHFAMD
jgi:cysteine desulfurase